MTGSPLTQQLIAFGAVYTPAQVEPGQSHWKLVSAEGPMEWGGRVSIFVELLDPHGQRAVGVRVRLFNGGNSFAVTEPKPGDDFAVDFPMYAANNAYGVAVADGLPSDEIRGMGLIPYKPHVVYKLKFQMVTAGDVAEPPVQLKAALDKLEQAHDLLDDAMVLIKGLLEASK